MDKDVTEMTLREVGDELVKNGGRLKRTAGRVYIVKDGEPIV
jgi:hypothetical protein